MRQADISYQGEAGRWVQVIKHKPHVGNNWSTAPITVAKKARALFPATVNEVHQQMNYSKVPTHGGFALIFPCETLPWQVDALRFGVVHLLMDFVHSGRKKSSGFFGDGDRVGTPPMAGLPRYSPAKRCTAMASRRATLLTNFWTW